MTSFIGCDGEWQFINGGISCSGTMRNVTETELAGLSSLTPDQMDALIQATIGLFAVVFVVIVIRKVL